MIDVKSVMVLYASLATTYGLMAIDATDKSRGCLSDAARTTTPRTDGAAFTSAVVDQDGVTPHFSELAGKQVSHDVCAASGAVQHEQHEQHEKHEKHEKHEQVDRPARMKSRTCGK